MAEYKTPYAGVAGWFNSMPSYIGPSDVAGLKLVGGYADNPQHGLPYIRANLMLTDPRTGFLRALIAGDWISDMRTGAQPAVAARYLAARTDVVAFVDSNVLLPRDYLKVMMACWDEETGMISVPAVGAAPGSFWAETECAILNTHQARWQLVADTCGMGFAQGKNLMFRKSVLDPLGGIAVLAQHVSMDVLRINTQMTPQQRPEARLVGRFGFDSKTLSISA